MTEVKMSAKQMKEALNCATNMQEEEAMHSEKEEKMQSKKSLFLFYFFSHYCNVHLPTFHSSFNQIE